MTMGERIKLLRKQHGMTQEELGEIIGVKKAAIQKYEKNNVKNMKRSSIEILSKLFNVSPSYLMCIDDNEKNNTRIPVLGRIPAGIPVEMVEDVIDYEDLSEDMIKGDKEYFALKIKGDSMSPTYLENDIVIFLKQNDCESGQDCVVAVNGDDATFKRVFKTDNGITLQPLNSSYMPTFYSKEDIINKPVKILGIAKQIRRNT